MTQIAQILQLFRDYPGLQLTGSRYFGTETPQSDWDFFIGESEVADSPLPYHFSKVEDNDYGGDPVVSYILYSSLLNCHVQVILDEYVNLKERAQFLIQNTGALYEVKNKYYAKAIWQAVLLALQQQLR